MKTGNRTPEGRGVAAATIAFVAMLMIGQTAPMEYVRDASMSADTVVYDTLEFSVEENSDAPVLDLFSTVSNADDCKMFVQGNDYLDNQHFTTPSNGMVSPDATMADVGLDYENPQDADADNSYEFRVRTHCPGNDITARNYFLNVTNVVFDIAGADTGTISEDAAAGTAVWAPTGMNDTTANCAISEGDSGSLFAINTTTCAITTAGAFDHDTTPSHTLNVTASTAGDLESDYHIVTVTVTDVNEAPTGHLEITGTLTEGETVSADATGVSDEDGMNMTDAEYQWYRGGAAIVNETASTYTLTNDDSLQSMQVSMTYNDTAGRSTMVMSNASAAVADVDNNDPASTAIPNQAVLEDASTTIDVSGYFSDADPGASLTYAIAGASFATINATGVITAAPAQADVGAHTANVTVQDDDGTETYQEFFLNVTNVNDAFELAGYTLGIAGDVHDGSALSPGYTATVETTYDAETTTTYSAAGSYEFSYVMESWFVGAYQGWAINIAIDGVTECQTGGSSLAYATANFLCSFTMAAGETASITYYQSYSTPYGALTMVHTSEPTTLTLDNSLLSDGDGMGTLAYQWYADGSAITGATSSTYTPEANNLSLIGNTYSVEISQTDALGTDESMMSSSSAALTLNPAGDLDGDTIANSADTDVDGDGYNATDQGDGLVDAFEFDEHAWADNDVDGKADTLHSSLNEVAYTTVELSNITLPSGTSSATDTITVPAGETLDVTLQTASYGSEGGAVVTAPDGTAYSFGPFSNNQFYELGSWTAGSTDEIWTIEYTDSYGDGCNASTWYGTICYMAGSYTYMSGFQPATVTPYGTALDTDDDNDGTPDDTDAFPFDDTEDTDADGDGIGANTDDLENDECYSVDTDADGYPDAGTAVAGCTSTLVEDSDDDGDGIANVDDCNVGDATQMFDTDGDGTCNSVDDDDDGDGVADWYDDYPLDGDAQYNADGDAFNNTVDADDDNDGITDDLDTDTDGDGYNNTDQGDGIVDWAPGDPDEWVDTDGDGLGNNLDDDDDADGVLDSADGCPTDGAASLDSDGDGLCDATLDDDDDNDGVLDVDDAFSLDPDADTDTDNDGKADSLNPNLPTEDAYTSVELCSFTLLSSDSGSFNGYQAVTCTGTAPSNVNEVTVSLTYGTSWASETGMYVLAPGATSYDLIYSGSNSAASTTSTLTYSLPGDYTLIIVDTYGDGCAGCVATLSYDYLSGSQPAQSTPFGTLLDHDDDQDGTEDTADAWPLDDCADTDTDGDGAPDSVCVADDFNTGWALDSGTGIASIQIDSSTGEPSITHAENFDTDPTDPNCAASITWHTYNTNTGSWDYVDASGLCNGDSYGPDNTVTSNTCRAIWGTCDDHTNYRATLSNAAGDISIAHIGLGASQPADTDDDNDGVVDASDAFPLDAGEDTDTDSDTIGNNADTDDDGDGVDDASEVTGCDLIADCDGDGVNDDTDAFPLDATEDTDTDGDGIGNNADIDDDADGVSDAYDWAPLNASEWRDFDGDGIGDTADTDDDGDLVADTEDAFPLDSSESADTDGDTVGDNTDMDDDNDGVDDYDSNGAQLDNCRTTVNANQANNDGDTTGDLCDDDDDNDGTDDTLDAFQMNDAASVDTDGDGMPDDFHQTNTTTVTACTLENTAGTGSADCTATISATGETLVYTLITANTWSSDLSVTALMPNGDIVTLADRDMDVLTTYTWTFNAVGTYVLTLTDFYSDGGDSAYSGIDLANRINENLSASLTTPEASSGGLTLDTDDDGDGYSDADESAGCAGEQAYATYESSSDPLDASSTPDDMDADNICDGLDMDRDGDGDFNYDVDYDGSVNYLHGDSEDVFPDDPAEKDDNDNDGTGDNADTDDDNDMWTDELENTCSGSEADGHSNQYDDTSTPDDYDSDMDCNTFDVDDDNDGVNDGPDPHPLDECYWSDNDQDGIADYNNEGNCVAHMTSFESGATGGIYTDTDTSGAAHDLANNAGEAEVNYDAPASYTVASVCPEGGAGFYVYGSGSCTVTVPSGGYADIGVYWPYGIPYVTLTATSPSGVATTPTTGFTATEAGDWTFDWGADGTWATIALLANVYTPETPFELGYQASWAPSANSGSGLTDGDYVGVTDYTGEVGAYLDGRLGYQMSDTDGAMTLTLDAIDPTGLTAAVSYFLADTTYEDDDSVSIDFVGSLSTVSLLSASGVSATDAAGGDGMEALAGAWTTVSADISAAGTGSLVITFDSNAGTEALYLDNVYFTTSYVALDSDDDNDMRLDGYDWCPLDPTEQDDNDEDGICDDTDLDDDNDGVFDFNDEFPYDGTEQTDDDGDGIGDNADTDDDNDGTDDANDAFPNDPSETDDFDGDGIGDNADTDDDGDGVSDTEDVWPLDNTMSTDTDGDGTADFYLTPAPYSLMDFESGSLPTEGTWTSYSCSIGGASAPVHPSVTCTNSTLYGPWTVSSSNSIAGAYSLDSGQNSNAYGTTSIMVQFETLGGTATWDWQVSAFLRTSVSPYFDGLEVWADGVRIPASSLGSQCANDVWCGEDSGSMSWDFVGAGMHDLTFTFRSGTSGQGGTNQAWIDNLQLPMNGVSNQMDTDDDNDGILDGDDLMQYDPCVGLDNDGDGAYDEMVGVGGAGVVFLKQIQHLR